MTTMQAAISMIPMDVEYRAEHRARRAPLTERYRPRCLDELRGQPEAVAFLRQFVEAPYPVALLFSGETGTGKTSAAVALAGELGCDVDRDGFGGVHQIASGEQNAEAVKATYDLMWQTPMFGSGWKVIILNEADRMSPAAETIWMDRLEALPPRTVVVFTTNYPEKLSRRLRDRCIELPFTSSAEDLGGEARELIRMIWRAERGTNPSTKIVEALAHRATVDGSLSFRRLVQGIQVALAAASTQTC